MHCIFESLQLEGLWCRGLAVAKGEGLIVESGLSQDGWATDETEEWVEEALPGKGHLLAGW